MQQTMSPPLKKLIVAILVVLAILAGWQIYLSTKFHIVKTNPSSNSVSSVTPFFKIYFNHTLKPGSVQFNNTQGLVSSYTVSGKLITFNLNVPLIINRAYYIDLISVTDASGTSIVHKRISFKPQNIDYKNLPDDQKKALLQQQSNYSQSHFNDPILAHLPHGTLGYNLTATTVSNNGSTDLTLNAQILLSAADLGPGEQAVINQRQQEVLDYIKSLGLDPSKYHIVFSTNQ